MPAAFELTFLDAEGVVRTVSPEHPLPIAGGAGGTVNAEDIADATATGVALMTAEDAAAARTAIGAGTSNLEIGTTASTAKAGNYQPTWAQVSNKPSTFAATPASVEDAVAAKAEIAALTEIADPETATAEDVANAVNAVIAALKA